jgi:hypothetical protein
MSDRNSQTPRRSPAYPYLNLEEIVNHAKAVFQKHRYNKVPAVVALDLMNYSISSGSGVRVLSALAQFGLFESEGVNEDRVIWFSELGKALVSGNPRDPEYLASLQKAALNPEIHERLYVGLQLESNPLPSDPALSLILRGEGFTEKAVEACIQEFKETLHYARLVIPSSQSGLPTESNGHNVLPSNPESADSSGNLETQELTTRLTRGNIARLIVPATISRTDSRLLAVWLSQLSEAVQETYDST